jgi:hypothetical protein
MKKQGEKKINETEMQEKRIGLREESRRERKREHGKSRTKNGGERSKMKMEEINKRKKN